MRRASRHLVGSGRVSPNEVEVLAIALNPTHFEPGCCRSYLRPSRRKTSNTRPIVRSRFARAWIAPAPLNCLR
jgi:hypothetical protein